MPVRAFGVSGVAGFLGSCWRRTVTVGPVGVASPEFFADDARHVVACRCAIGVGDPSVRVDAVGVTLEFDLGRGNSGRRCIDQSLSEFGSLCSLHPGFVGDRFLRQLPRAGRVAGSAERGQCREVAVDRHGAGRCVAGLVRFDCDAGEPGFVEHRPIIGDRRPVRCRAGHHDFGDVAEWETAKDLGFEVAAFFADSCHQPVGGRPRHVVREDRDSVERQRIAAGERHVLTVRVDEQDDVAVVGSVADPGGGGAVHGPQMVGGVGRDPHERRFVVDAFRGQVTVDFVG